MSDYSILLGTEIEIVQNYCHSSSCSRCVCIECPAEESQVEEVEKITESCFSKIERIYFDGTVGPEIVSIPMTKEELKQFHKEVVDQLRQNNFQITPRRGAGGHITVSATRDQEPINFHPLIIHRLFNLVRRFLPVLLINSCEQGTWKRGTAFRNYPKSNDFSEKYQAIRLRDDPHLVEFRYPDGTMDEKIFNRTVDLIEAIVRYCLENDVSPIKAPERRLSQRLSFKIMNEPTDFEAMSRSPEYQQLRDLLANLLNLPLK